MIGIEAGRVTRGKALLFGFLLAAFMAVSLLAAKPAHAATFTVNSTADPGNGTCNASECTLREAITASNSNNNDPVVDTIDFDIGGGTGVKTIQLNSELPATAEAVIIDGYSQPGASENTLAQGTNAVLKIELDGTNAGANAIGLTIVGSNSTVRGLVIDRFAEHGILISPSSGVKVEGNFIGTDPSGITELGNGNHGVFISDTENTGDRNHTVGGASPAARNLISGNESNGIGVSSDGNEVQGNIVSSNGGDGVAVFNNRTNNSILSNSIFSNGNLGIDLGDDGVTANDPGDGDTGANDLQNFPVLSSAANVSGFTNIQGTLNSTPNSTFTVQFFKNPSGTDEGKTFLGETSVTTNSSGNKSFVFGASPQVPQGERITATATSSSGDTSEFSKPVTVNNRAPVANDDSYEVNEDATLTVPDGPTDVLGNDTDPDGDPLTAKRVIVLPDGGPTNGTLTFNENGSFTYTPDANFFGTDSFAYEANDGQTDSNTATVNITVNPVNDAPSFSKGPDQAVSEDSGTQTVPDWATNISKGPANESGQSVSFLVTNDNNALFSSQPAVSPDGTLTFTPAADQSGTATVSIKIKDDGGTESGGDDESNSQSFTIFVTPLNDPPVADDDSYSVKVRKTLTVSPSSGVLANDSDPEGDTLTVADADAATAGIQPLSGPSKGKLTLNADGSFTYKAPKKAPKSPVTFTYKANDGTSDSNVATVSIRVRR